MGSDIRSADASVEKPFLLFLAQRLPFPPTKGDKVRSSAVLRHLSRSWRPRLFRRRPRRPARVTVTGRVSDVRPYLAHADAVVAPVRLAKGIQNKVLEGMAMGSVVVTTPGGWQGIDAEPGRHLLVADSAPDFAAATLRALTDPDCDAIRRAARELVTERYGWEAPLRSFDELLTSKPPPMVPDRQVGL